MSSIIHAAYNLGEFSGSDIVGIIWLARDQEDLRVKGNIVRPPSPKNPHAGKRVFAVIYSGDEPTDPEIEAFFR